MATIKQLTDAYAAVNAGRQPSPAILAQLTSLANLSVNGPISDAQALGYILNNADKTTSLALLGYQFFTGKSPTQAGLAYLTNSPDNPNDLNDAYYAGFSLEDRYINLAGNLATAGEGATAFAAKYGTLDFSAYVASIYETIVGGAYAAAAGWDPTAAIAGLVAQHDALLAKAQASGLITAGMSAAQVDLALKAVTAGYLMSQTVQSDVGLYASAANNFMVAQITGKADYNTDLTTVYAAAPGTGGGDGQVAGWDFSFTPPPPPPPPPPPEPDPDPAYAFTLTTSADTFTGQSADDTFTGTAIYTTTTENPSSTYNAALDVLDGAGGYDILSLAMSGSAAQLTINSTRVKNIERLSVVNTASGTSMVTLSSNAPFTELVSGGTGANTTFTGFGNTVTNLGVSNQRSGTIRFTVDNTTLTGANDAVTLTLTNDGTSTSSVPIINLAPASGTDFYETLNVVSSGTANYVTLTTGTTQTSLTKLNLSGAAPLTLGFNNNDKVRLVTTIDARAATGGVTIGGTAAATTLGVANQTIILGTGANIVNFGANLTAGDTVDGSRGSNDTLAIVGNVTDVHVFDHVTGVENIRFFNPTGTSTQDVQLLPTGVGLQLGGGTGTVTLQNLANNTSLDVVSNAGLNVALALANNTGADALTLRFNSTASGGGVLGTLSNITGLETLNIVSTGPGTQHNITDDLVAARHVITGDVALSISAYNAILTSPMTVDATAFTARLDFSSSQISGAAGVTFLMGSGGGTLTGGPGVDRYVLGIQGQNSSTYYLANVQGGNDIVSVMGNKAAGGGAATDYLSPNVTADIRSGSSNVTGLTLIFSADDHDFSLRNAAGTAFTGLAKGAVSHGLTAGDSMITQDLSRSAGAFAATTDVAMIRLTANTGFVSDAKTLFQTAIGTSSITGLAADSNYLVSVYDPTNSRTVIAVVNTGASGAGDTVLSAADFTDHGMAMVSVILSSSLMGGTTLGLAF
ncbi:beta strand repeat-containing protein [Caulobacter segnis]